MNRHQRRAARAQGRTVQRKDGSRVTECDEHGPQPWRATVVCVACDRFYRLEDDAPAGERPASETMACDCGADLVRSARCICEKCYSALVALRAAGHVAPVRALSRSKERAS